jgi:2Fe-2S ferredoxin
LSALLDRAAIDPTLHPDLLKVLQSVYGTQINLVPHVQALSPQDLQALAASVAQEQRSSRKPPVRKRRRTIHLAVPHHNSDDTLFEITWKQGESLLVLVQRQEHILSDYALEGTCGGNASCCSCHVYLDEESWRALPPPDETESDLLDVAFEPQESSSRLACQVRLNQTLLDAPHEITVTIPAGVHNIWKE